MTAPATFKETAQTTDGIAPCPAASDKRWLGSYVDIISWRLRLLPQASIARLTVHDCLQRVPKPFELDLLAGERAQQLADGESRTIHAAGEPRTLVALREIGAGTVDLRHLRDRIIARRRHLSRDVPETDEGHNGDWSVDYVTDREAESPVVAGAKPEEYRYSHAA